VEVEARRGGAWGLTPYAAALLCLASILPFIGFLDENRDEPISTVRVLLYAALVAVVALAVQLVVTRLTRADPDRLAVSISLVVLSFFSFSRWLEAEPREGQEVLQVVIWAAVTAAFAVLAYRFARASGFRLWLLVTAAAWSAIVAFSFGQYSLTHRSARELAESDTAPPVTPEDAVERPNVYFFLLDFYARNDVLADLVGYDNSGFHEDLEARGFVVADRALASYPVTSLSTMSTFEMGYPATEPQHFAAGIEGFTRFIRGDNQTVERFHDLGYEYVYSPNGVFSFGRCSAEFADHCIAPDDGGATLGDLELEILELTPFGSLDLFRPPRTDPAHVVDGLEEVTDLREPFFLFAHIMSPHPPYRYRDDCSVRDDGIERLSLSPEDERAQYAVEVRCLNDALTASIDRILERDPDAIVLVQSDHGSEFLTNWFLALEDWSNEALVERFGVQNALRLPERCQDDVTPETPLVNTFRIVFACLEGREPDLLDHRGFFWRWEDRENVVEIPPERLEGG
jgi:hypothetical protein